MFFTTYHSDIGLRAASDDAAKTNNNKKQENWSEKNIQISASGYVQEKDSVVF